MHCPNSIQQNPSSKANSHSADQQIPLFYRTGKFTTTARHCTLFWKLNLVHTSRRIIPSQPNSGRTLPSYLYKIHFNIIRHWRLCLPNFVLPSGFPNKIPYAFVIVRPHAAHLPAIYFSFIWYSNNLWRVHNMKLIITKVLCPPVAKSTLDSSTSLSSSFSHTLSFCFPSGTHTRFHTHKKQVKL